MYSGSTRREETLLRTRLAPPHLRRRVLARPALNTRLLEALDYRLTIVQAGTGYSKTTALASLAKHLQKSDDDVLCFWYSAGESDADPGRFLLYLLSAFRMRFPDMPDLLFMSRERGVQGGPDAWKEEVDALVNALHERNEADSLLVIDDYHLVAHSTEVRGLLERFLLYMPAWLHVVLATRYPPDWAILPTWRARGEVLEIGRKALAFGLRETEALFNDVYGCPLKPEELANLIDRTEGWPIALQLVWQGMREREDEEGRAIVAGRRADELLGNGDSLHTLFDYLANEVTSSQTDEIQQFLLDTSVLRVLTPGACDAVSATDGASASLLQKILEMDLFVVDVSSGGSRHYRYHHLFHDFLRQQSALNPASHKERHRRAARYYGENGQHEEAIYHWLAIEDHAEAARAIESAAEGTLGLGWLSTVSSWIVALPREVVERRPVLQSYMGDVCRLGSRFDEALMWYTGAEKVWREAGDMAGVCGALRGQALIYLDTVRPAWAESILQEALDVSEGLDDPEERARLLDLLAENNLNMGRPDEAERLRVQAREMRRQGPGEDVLSVRVKLRTGQVGQAAGVLDSWLERERAEVLRGGAHAPRAHRETLLLLSLIASIRGEGERAFSLATEGIAMGERLHSPFVTAVGHIRLGHAWQLRIDPGRDTPGETAYMGSVKAYEEAAGLGDRLAVRRLRAEIMWGLTRAYGFSGDLAGAERAASEGVSTGRWAGDAWIVALVELALGASYTLAGRYAEGASLLERVETEFQECGDSLGRTATYLWLALARLGLGRGDAALSSVKAGLDHCEAYDYGFLFTSHSLLGPPDPRRLAPLLMLARQKGSHVAYAGMLLGEMGLAGLAAHPGYKLRVQMLGAFRVWRGDTEVEPREWQRGTARQLFQLLLTERGHWLQREEITERLWPQLAAGAAQRDFKVALNAVKEAIEPMRGADGVSAYIEREGSAYRLRSEADMWIDCEAFERGCQSGLTTDDISRQLRILKSAIDLYGGAFLPDALYEDWSGEERGRLLSLFLRSGDKLAGLLLDSGAYSEALSVCERLLAQDPCWEGAYKTMMLTYHKQGDRAMALRAYNRCVQTLQTELGVEPSEEIEAAKADVLGAEG